MGNPHGWEITEILRAWRAGNEQALDKLTPEIYRELKRAARQCMRNERDGHTLQTTALINELYLRLPDLQEIDWQARAESPAQDLGKQYPLDTQMKSLWLPAIHAQLPLDRKNPASALTALQAASPIELGQIQFVANISCLCDVTCSGEAYLAAPRAQPSPRGKIPPRRSSRTLR